MKTLDDLLDYSCTLIPKVETKNPYNTDFSSIDWGEKCTPKKVPRSFNFYMSLEGKKAWEEAMLNIYKKENEE